ncbi:kinase-like protein [Ceratobasidium sp. AG-I]|nr:kinase-like protein [Ceratobasidium sp. AG-I]
MEVEQPPPYALVERPPVTFAEVAAKIDQITTVDDTFRDSLAIFQEFLSVQEDATILKGQLRLLRGQIALALEKCAIHAQQGYSSLEAMEFIKQALVALMEKTRMMLRWKDILQNRRLIDDLEELILDTCEGLNLRLEQLDGVSASPGVSKSLLIRAQVKDRESLRQLEFAVGETLPHTPDNLNARLQNAMIDLLKIIDGQAVWEHQVDAKRSLAIITELTGTSLPPSTLLGKDFVTIGKQAINHGANYDIFLGEFFTGEKIAIKTFRQRVDQETAKKTQEQFARQTLNWSSLRHDCILPLYGIGLIPSQIHKDEFQLYLVSPYLQNQDVQTYLKKYTRTSLIDRLQMALNVARGLEYMHEKSGLPRNRIVHGAINTSNVLVKDSGHTVISGFGHAKIIEGVHAVFSGQIPMFRYLGPEILEDAVLTYGSDIWGWAMTTLEILSDVLPWGNCKAPTVIRMVGSGEQPRRSDHPKIEEYSCSDDIWELFEECWRRIPEKRPTAMEVVRRVRLIIEDSGNTTRPGVNKSSDAISRTMSAGEVIRILGRHGCPDITSSLDLKRCSNAPIAGGGFGDVFTGWTTGETKVAIKCPRLFVQSTKEDYGMLKSMAHEMYAWSKCRHPNVIEPAGLAQFRGQMCLVSPWMENGTLSTYLVSKPDADRCAITAQISSGLAYLHAKDIVHGDVKAQNILVAGDGAIKLTDFGNTTLKTYTLRFTGTRDQSSFSLRWAAPEQLEGLSTYSISGDVYALGMTILEVLTGRVPYADFSDAAVYGKVLVKRQIPDRPTGCLPFGSTQANVLWATLVQCWAFEPAARPSVTEVEKTFNGITREGLMKISSTLPQMLVSQASPIHGRGGLGLPFVKIQADQLSSIARGRPRSHSEPERLASSLEPL